MRRDALLIGLSLLCGCPSRDARPSTPAHETIVQAHETTAEAHEATPRPAPTWEAMPAAAVVDVPPDPPITALSAPVPTHDAPVRLEGIANAPDVRYAAVDLPDEAARADLDRRLRAALYTLTSVDGRSRGSCHATLATAELVSVMCDLTTRGGREQAPGPLAEAVTFRLGARGAKRVAPGAAFVDEARIERAVCAKALGHLPADEEDCATVAVSFAPDHLVGRLGGYDEAHGRMTVKRVDVPYAELASLVRPDGMLAFAAGAAPTGAAPLSLQAATPEPRLVTAYGSAGTPAAVASALLRARLGYANAIGLPDGHGRVRLSVDQRLPEETQALVRAAGPAERVPLGPAPLQLLTMETREATTLLDAPRGHALRVLPVGTAVVAFDGEVRGEDSQWSPARGLFAYVVASEGSAGWVEAPEVAYDSGNRGDPAHADAAFDAALPPEARDAVKVDTILVTASTTVGNESRTRQVRIGRTPSASFIGIYDDASTLLFARLDGAADDVRVVDYGVPAPSMVVASARVAGDPPGVERWTVLAVQGGAQLLAFTARTAPDVAAAERAVVKTFDQDFHELAVDVTEGSTHRRYAWNGTALVAAE